MTLDYFKIYRYNFYPFPFLYLLQNFESHSSKLSIFFMEKPLQCNSAQFHEIPRIFKCFLVGNYSAIPSNEMTVAEANIACNSAQRNSDWKP